jgi:hypothetical protein
MTEMPNGRGRDPAVATNCYADWQPASSTRRQTNQAQILDDLGHPLRRSSRLDHVPYGPRLASSSWPGRRWREAQP